MNTTTITIGDRVTIGRNTYEVSGLTSGRECFWLTNIKTGGRTNWNLTTIPPTRII